MGAVLVSKVWRVGISGVTVSAARDDTGKIGGWGSLSTKTWFMI